LKIYTLAELEYIGENANENELEAHHECTPESIDVLSFTSGTTGQPKGVMVSHKAYLLHATAQLKQELQSKTTMLDFHIFHLLM
jgi:long-subunit acyl-CoA synthetase (AMP-forming)